MYIWLAPSCENPRAIAAVTFILGEDGRETGRPLKFGNGSPVSRVTLTEVGRELARELTFGYGTGIAGGAPGGTMEGKPGSGTVGLVNFAILNGMTVLARLMTARTRG
jgi:hypothetical protein